MKVFLLQVSFKGKGAEGIVFFVITITVTL